MGATCPRSSICWGWWLLPGRQAHPSQPTGKIVFCKVPRGTPNASTHLIACTVLLVFEQLGSCCKFGFCRQLSPHFSGAVHWAEEPVSSGRSGQREGGPSPGRCVATRGKAWELVWRPRQSPGQDALLTQQPCHRKVCVPGPLGPARQSRRSPHGAHILIGRASCEQTSTKNTERVITEHEPRWGSERRQQGTLTSR